MGKTQTGLSNVALIIIVAVVVGGGYFGYKTYTSKAQKSVATTASKSEIDTTNWKTFRNEDFGVEVKYPEDWEVGNGTTTDTKTKTVTSLIVNLVKPFISGIRNGVAYQEGNINDPRPSIALQWQKGLNPTNLTIKDWHETEMAKLSEVARERVKNSEKITDTELQGIPTVLVQSTISTGGNYHYYISTHDTDILSVSYTLQPQFEKTYKTILSTFKLIK